MPASVADCGIVSRLRRDPEVGLRGRFDPVGAVSEVHRVQVLREDRVLRERAFHLEGEEHLTDLLLDRARRDHVVGDPVLALDVVTRVHTLHELLRDRRAPLDLFARDQVAPRRADRALEVHAAVVVEASVLHGDHGVPEMLGDLPHRDDRPVDGAVERGQQLAVAVVHERGLDRRERLRQIDPYVGERQHAEPEERERDGRQRERPPVPAEESPGATSSWTSGQSSWTGRFLDFPEFVDFTDFPVAGRRPDLDVVEAAPAAFFWACRGR